jgi:hypothetical protein
MNSVKYVFVDLTKFMQRCRNAIAANAENFFDHFR